MSQNTLTGISDGDFVAVCMNVFFSQIAYVGLK